MIAQHDGEGTDAEVHRRRGDSVEVMAATGLAVTWMFINGGVTLIFPWAVGIDK